MQNRIAETDTRYDAYVTEGVNSDPTPFYTAAATPEMALAAGTARYVRLMRRHGLVVTGAVLHFSVEVRDDSTGEAVMASVVHLG